MYLSAVSVYASYFFRGGKYSDILKTPLLYITVVIHFIYIIIRTIAFAHPPITTSFEIMTLVAFCITVTYLYIEVKTKVKGTGLFIMIVALVFQINSSIFIQDLINVPEVLKSNLLGSHVSTALIGLSAITISAIYGTLYLMLYHEIKSNHFGLIYKRLPNLEILERMSFTATKFGFVFLTVAIIIGFIWLPRAYEKFSYSDPKLIGTLLIWCLYAVGLAANKVARWQGKKIVWLAIIGFIISFFSMTFINMFLSGFHKFI